MCWSFSSPSDETLLIIHNDIINHLRFCRRIYHTVLPESLLFWGPICHTQIPLAELNWKICFCQSDLRRHECSLMTGLFSQGKFCTTAKLLEEYFLNLKTLTKTENSVTEIHGKKQSSNYGWGTYAKEVNWASVAVRNFRLFENMTGIKKISLLPMKNSGLASFSMC